MKEKRTGGRSPSPLGLDVSGQPTWLSDLGLVEPADVVHLIRLFGEEAGIGGGIAAVEPADQALAEAAHAVHAHRLAGIKGEVEAVPGLGGHELILGVHVADIRLRLLALGVDVFDSGKFEIDGTGHIMSPSFVLMKQKQNFGHFASKALTPLISGLVTGVVGLRRNFSKCDDSVV